MIRKAFDLVVGLLVLAGIGWGGMILTAPQLIRVCLRAQFRSFQQVLEQLYFSRFTREDVDTGPILIYDDARLHCRAYFMDLFMPSERYLDLLSITVKTGNTYMVFFASDGEVIEFNCNGRKLPPAVLSSALRKNLDSINRALSEAA